MHVMNDQFSGTLTDEWKEIQNGRFSVIFRI